MDIVAIVFMWVIAQAFRLAVFVFDVWIALHILSALGIA